MPGLGLLMAQRRRISMQKIRMYVKSDEFRENQFYKETDDIYCGSANDYYQCESNLAIFEEDCCVFHGRLTAALLASLNNDTMRAAERRRIRNASLRLPFGSEGEFNYDIWRMNGHFDSDW